MTKFYRENTGDYLCIDTEQLVRDAVNPQYRIYEGRATAIRGDVSSVCTTGISAAFLHQNCKRVNRVPKVWREAMGV